MGNLITDLSAPIIPGKTIGGLPLGISLEELSCRVDGLEFIHNKFVGTAEYKLNNGAISVGVHEASGVVFRIGAHNGYVGKLDEKYGPGMPSEKFLKSDEWYFSEEHGVLLHNSHSGVCAALGLEWDDPYLSDFQGQLIEEVSIFFDTIAC